MSQRRTELNGTLDLGQTGSQYHHNISQRPYVSIQMVLDNTDAYGEVVVETSNNEDNWSTVYWKDENGTIQDGYDVTVGNDMNHIVDAVLGTGWIRLKYNRVSGDGTLNYYISIKR